MLAWNPTLDQYHAAKRRQLNEWLTRSDEYSLDKSLMFFSIVEKMHGIRYRAINMVAIAGKVSANQGLVAP